MRIVIIGSGNVGSVLGRLCKQNEHEIIQVFSRNANQAVLLAKELKCALTDQLNCIDTEADLYLVALTDAALVDLKNHLFLGNKLILHTAGSVSKEVLKDISLQYGVLYPLQSLRKEMTYSEDIPFVIDGNSDAVKSQITDFVKTISSNFSFATDEERIKLHLAAVIVSNFTNHLYALAEHFCNIEKIDFSLLWPLVKETARRVQVISPSIVQTGPAVRKDMLTIEKHISLLANHPELKALYQNMTDSIMKI